MECCDVAPCFGIPDLDQAILAATGHHRLCGVPVTRLHIPAMACQGALCPACWEVPDLHCTYALALGKSLEWYLAVDQVERLQGEKMLDIKCVVS